MTTVTSVVIELTRTYQAQLNSIIDELAQEPDTFRRKSLREARDGLEYVLSTIANVTDVATAFAASQHLQTRIVGSHPAVFVQIIDHAICSISERILTPVQATIPEDQARPAAVRFLSRQLKPSDKKAILADISNIGLAAWISRNHFPFGMAVRNALRAAGFTEATLRIASLDDLWGTLVHEAAQIDS